MRIRSAFRVSVLLLAVTAPLGCSASNLKENESVTNEDSCQSPRLEASIATLHKLLDDVKETYDQVGGEITQVQLVATGVYVISIAQEERIDRLKYQIETASDCSTRIVGKEVSSVAPWETD